MIVGIVGKANVGKSTFFKALTLAEVEIANYPFATIDPNNGIGFVKVEDVAKEFGKTSDPREGFVKGNYRFVPVQVIDVAGLVPGAHEGKGLGQQFLSDLNQANVLIHVIDASGGTNEKGEPVTPGSYDPANDIKFLEIELDYWYLGILKKGWEKFIRTIKAEHMNAAKAITQQMSGVGVDEDMAKQATKDFPEDMSKWSEEQLLLTAKRLRMMTKPMVIAANKADHPEAEKNIDRLINEFPNHKIVPVTAESELALKEADKHELINYTPGEDNFEILQPDKLSPQQKNALDFISDFIKEHGSTGLQDCLNTAVFDILKYKALFPGGVGKLEDSDGNVLPDCFLMPGDTTALDFAYRLHSDFGDNFVKAVNVKTKMPVGKDSELNNLDIVEIMSSK